MVCFIHREEYYDRENEDLKGKAEIIIAKQRNGPTGSIHLAYLADYTRFENLQHGDPGGYYLRFSFQLYRNFLKLLTQCCQ